MIWYALSVVPSGKLTVCYGKAPSSMGRSVNHGNSTRNGPFSLAMKKYQRVSMKQRIDRIGPSKIEINDIKFGLERETKWDSRLGTDQYGTCASICDI